jgi:hypothetical protein
LFIIFDQINQFNDTHLNLFEQQRINLEKLKTTAQARNSKRSNDHPVTNDRSQNIADEIHYTNMEIFALEMAKSESINRVYIY